MHDITDRGLEMARQISWRAGKRGIQADVPGQAIGTSDQVPTLQWQDRTKQARGGPFPSSTSRSVGTRTCGSVDSNRSCIRTPSGR